MKKELIPSEHKEQVAFVNWLKKEKIFYYAVPNGGTRDANTRMMLKSEGMIAGIPDIVILLEGGKSLFIEMKRRKGGTVSKVQKEIHSKIENLGFKVGVCKGAREAVDYVKNEM